MVKKIFRYQIIIGFLAITLVSCMKSEQADLVVHNATIYTVDGAFSKQQAMAVKDGKIIEIGADRQILNKYKYTEELDAKKQVIYPGFIDGHCHFLSYGLSLNEVNLVGTKSFDEVISRIVEHAKTSKDEWITGRGWDQNDWEVKDFPIKDTLDKLFPNRPVFVRRIDGHAGLANQKALDLGNVTVQTKIHGGEVFLKRDGTLTGVLLDNAMDFVKNVIPQPTTISKTEALKNAQQNCFAAGLTTVDIAGLDVKDILLIDSLQFSKELNIKIYAMLTPTEESIEYARKGIHKNEMLTCRSFKLYGDGALGSRGAALKHPYTDDTTNHGMMGNAFEFYEKFAKICYDLDYQMNTHCIGDAANNVLLNIYGSKLKGTNDKRWRIEHAQVVSSQDLSLFKKYNIIPSVQPTHATSDMYWAEERLGHERVKSAYAYKQLLMQNGIIALGTDFPIEGIEPLNTFYAAITRKDHKGFPEEGFQMDNALSRKEALMGMTIFNAIANFEENEKGSLEVGKAADFVMLNADIMEIPEEEILNAKVLATYINGKKVF